MIGIYVAVVLVFVGVGVAAATGQFEFIPALLGIGGKLATQMWLWMSRAIERKQVARLI